MKHLKKLLEALAELDRVPQAIADAWAVIKNAAEQYYDPLDDNAEKRELLRAITTIDKIVAAVVKDAEPPAPKAKPEAPAASLQPTET